MTADRIADISGRQIWCLFTVGAAALLVTGVQPILIGTLIGSNFMSLQLAGFMATLETIAIWLGFFLATRTFPLSIFRPIAALALMGLVVANASSAAAPNFEMLVLCRLGAGFCGGALLWIVTSAVVRTPAPERLSGYFMAGYTLFQSIAVMVLATWLVPSFSWRGCFLLLAGTSAVSLLGVASIPTQLNSLPPARLGRGRISMPVLLAGTVAFVQIVVTITIWAFLEPIGRLTGASAQLVQLLISVSLLVQILGAAAGGKLSTGLPALPTHLLATFALLAISVGILTIVRLGPAAFVVTAVSFSFLWMFILPFQVKLALDVDPSGHLALQVPGLQILGGAVAPMAAGIIAGDGPASDVTKLSVAGACVTLIAIVMLMSRSWARGRQGSMPPPAT